MAVYYSTNKMGVTKACSSSSEARSWTYSYGDGGPAEPMTPSERRGCVVAFALAIGIFVVLGLVVMWAASIQQEKEAKEIQRIRIENQKNGTSI